MGNGEDTQMTSQKATKDNEIHSVPMCIGYRGLCSMEIRKQSRTEMGGAEGWVWLTALCF